MFAYAMELFMWMSEVFFQMLRMASSSRRELVFCKT